ncbi:hypothetical protein LCGC14_0209050 [marine sediment metagenome]|uniref:Uncharacterized protein n=1 Tax=marine sediment metagenome TaxID=412755 RepID=A0A0F9ULA9_9ZZZZ
MARTETYRKDANGDVLVRRVHTQEDIHGVTFTVRDTEEPINKKALRRLKEALKTIREELQELQEEKTILVDNIAKIETARDS